MSCLNHASSYSGSIGVKRTKLSRLTKVTSMLLFLRNFLCTLFKTSIPAKPLPNINIRIGQPLPLEFSTLLCNIFQTRLLLTITTLHSFIFVIFPFIKCISCLFCLVIYLLFSHNLVFVKNLFCCRIYRLYFSLFIQGFITSPANNSTLF